MASSVSHNSIRTSDDRRFLAGGAIAFFVLAVIALVIGQAFVTVLALAGAFALTMAASGRRVFGSGNKPADDDED